MQKNRMHIHDHTGDTLVEWQTAVKEEVSTAQALFDQALGERKMAYIVDAETRKAQHQIFEFDPNVKLIHLIGPLVGG